MYVMTWHGKMLALQPEKPELRHLPLDVDLAAHLVRVTALNEGGSEGFRAWWDDREEQAPIEVNLSLLPGVTLVKASRKGCVHLAANGLYASASPTAEVITWDRSKADVWETFLLLTAEDVADLTHVLSHRWALRSSGRLLARREIALSDGFMLRLGKIGLNLQRNLPLKSVERAASTPYSPPQSFIVPGDASNLDEIISDEHPSASGLDEVDLGDLADEDRPAIVSSVTEFSLCSDVRLGVSDPHPIYLWPPISISRDTLKFFVTRYYDGHQAPLGWRTDTSFVNRESNKFVVLARWSEGSIFDERGVSVARGYMFKLEHYPPGLAIRSGRLVGYMRSLRTVPRLKGSYAVFYNGNLQNYYHWLIDALLPLFILSRSSDVSFSLLLPTALDQLPGIGYRQSLKMLGFDQASSLTVSDPVVLVEEAIWLQDRTIELIPAVQLQAFRDLMTEQLSGVSMRRRGIYVRRRQAIRGIENTDQIEEYLRAKGFEVVEPNAMSVVEQAVCFQQADFVVAAHGAALANLIYCRAGTKVLELSPDCEFRPFFWLLSEKIGLIHGLLPCSTHTGTFNGTLRVDIDQFDQLFRLLAIYR